VPVNNRVSGLELTDDATAVADRTDGADPADEADEHAVTRRDRPAAAVAAVTMRRIEVS